MIKSEIKKLSVSGLDTVGKLSFLSCYDIFENKNMDRYMYIGHCHCGNVKLTIPQLTGKATRCNCTICSRYSAIWGYFKEKDVIVSVGELGISGYSYGEKTINFISCNKCHCITHYISIPSSPDAKLAVNYRMFDAKLLSKIEFRYFDGAKSWKSMKKKYWIQDG
ncbi:hypothetical protein L3V83_00605 [Thiotrichales bacterium 19X7-9]|nr:hypothetical protein [Thiotrichales bacterium 19X7-9]